MVDRNQLKAEGIRFARSLQLVFKTASMFSGTQATSQLPLQTSFDLLNELVKASRQFTIGFIDDRVLLNNILTIERTLQALETEFLKRGIGAVTFDAGITLMAYKRAVGVLSAPAKEIEAQGGLSAYLQNNPLDFVRAFPASKNQQRNEAGDTILQMDSESFLMAKALNEMGDHSLDRLDWFMQQAGIGGQGGGPRSGGAGQGGGTGAGGGYDGSDQGAAGSASSANGSDAPGTGSGIAGTGTGAGGSGVAPASVGPGGIESVVQSYFDKTLLESDDLPQRSYVELARVIQDTRPEFVLQNFPPQRREELRKMPPQQMAAEVIEDTAIKWAAERLVSAPSGQDAVVVEEEVVRVLLRSLQATQMAGRLARKLAEHVKNLQIPQSTYSRIQEELEWVVVPQREKVQRLLVIEHYSRMQFRRLIELLTELMKAGEQRRADALVTHYFKILDSEIQPQPEELGRAPELINTVAGLRSDFWSMTSEGLCSALNRWSSQEFLHQQLVNSCNAICKTLALYEKFELIDGIGKNLERLAAEDPAQHSRCCGQAVAKLMTQSAVDRVVELFIQRKDEHNWMRVCVNLLRRSGAPGIARVFQYLEDETSATIRMALLRLIGRLGPEALHLARERIADSRWYVVRNACKLLADLKDPDLLAYIEPALRHSDERVQKAALAAILESRNPNRASVLAATLPFLRPQVLDDVLRELMFLRDPVCVPALEDMIFVQPGGAKVRQLCVQTLASIPCAASELILLRVLADTSLEPAARRSAIPLLVRSQLSSTQHALSAFAKSNPSDPLTADLQRALAAKA